MHYSNQHADEIKSIIIKPVSASDRSILRSLAEKWVAIAKSPEMQVRKRQWRALKDLKPERPMILFETLSVTGYIPEDTLLCTDELLRNAERTMRYCIRQHDELGDDIVLEEYFRLAWKVTRSDYGVRIVEHHAENSMGYLSNFPIQSPDDLTKLKERTFHVDREQTLGLKGMLEDVFGDILPVRVGNYDNFFPDTGFTPFTGNNFIGITMDLFKLMGNENMLMWPYDYPDELRQLLGYLRDDRIRFYNWMKSEGLMDFNTDNQFAGPSSYGYCSTLPQMDAQKDVEFKDCWAWPESQECTPVSPKMFDEFFLPYIADVANMFGLTYYGCCEPVDDRFEVISKALPNLRAVSVSGWNNFFKMGEMLGNKYVYSRKPTPAFLSGKTPDWEQAEKDIRDTWAAAKNGAVEFIVRDVYDIDYDIPRIRKWVDMTKKIIGI